MWLVRVAIALLGAYAVVVATAYLIQDRVLFPARLAGGSPPLLPPSTTRISIETPSGERLAGVLIPAAGRRAGSGPALLAFGGNAWNAETLALFLRQLFPDEDVIAFHYRGYGQSTGRPSAAALLADAPLIFDHLAGALGRDRIEVVGMSIGSAVAAHLAAERPVAGLILVTAFDSLTELAAQHYGWAGVRWLLRHRMEPAAAIRAVDAPVALISAGQDRIVPAARTEPLRKAIPNLVLDRVIAGAGHNDIFNRPEFVAAMAEARAAIRTPAVLGLPPADAR